MKRGKAVKIMQPETMAAWDRVEKAILREIRKWDGIASQEELQGSAPFMACGCLLAIRNLVSPLPPRKRARKVK